MSDDDQYTPFDENGEEDQAPRAPRAVPVLALGFAAGVLSLMILLYLAY